MDKVLERIFFDLQNGKLSHAIMLDGGTSEDRIRIAKEVAKALVCSGKQAPCGACFDCLKADSSSHPDILLYSGGTTVGSFKVETVREIRQTASILPNEAERKVFILENTESMGAGAQNALLKILEEPPQYVCFILTCNAQSSMLDTILSRVTVYSCPQNIKPDSEIELKARALAFDILKEVANHQEWRALSKTAAFEKDKELIKVCAMEMRIIAQKALVNKIAESDEDSQIEEIGCMFSRSQLSLIIQSCGEFLEYIQGNLNNNLLITVFCAKLFQN